VGVEGREQSVRKLRDWMKKKRRRDISERRPERSNGDPESDMGEWRNARM
jgi:hypothetical protein